MRTFIDILTEDEVIPVKNEGVLEVPEGKSVDDLPESHFQKLIDEKGWGEISRALVNLEIWNKAQNPKLAGWARKMHDALHNKNSK